MKKSFLSEYTKSPIKTVEQADFIKNILTEEDGMMTHRQIGEIIYLSAELDNSHYKDALQFIQGVVFYQVAEQYKNDLIAEILKRNNLVG